MSLQSLFSAGRVIELQYTDSQAKSIVIVEVISEILLASKNEASVSKVLFFDLRGHFDILHLVSHIDFKTEGKLGEDEIKRLLSCLMVVRVTSYENMLVTLHSLESLIANSKDFGTFILDSMSAFYWLDVKEGFGDMYLSKIVDILDTFRSKYGLSVISTVEKLITAKSPDQNVEPYLCQKWQDSVDLKVSLSIENKNKSSYFILKKKLSDEPVIKFTYIDNIVKYN